MKRIRQENLFKLFLRISGTVSLLALLAVFLPFSWMNVAHQRLGMGTLPSEPIVGYLARSTSAFYAFFGGLLWLASFDLKQYRQLLIYIGVTHILFGLMLLIVDLLEGMPVFWSVVEGPCATIFGVIIVVITYRLSHE